jgi:hypothetical protein
VRRGGPQTFAHLIQDRDDFFHRHANFSLTRARCGSIRKIIFLD